MWMICSRQLLLLTGRYTDFKCRMMLMDKAITVDSIKDDNVAPKHFMSQKMMSKMKIYLQKNKFVKWLGY